MEDNNDMPSASASETQPIGEAGEAAAAKEVPDPMAIFGNDDSNNIRQTLPPEEEMYK